MTKYQEDAKNITRYLQIYGMLEKFDGRSYTVHDTEVNKHLYNWTQYENNVTLNSHGLYQLTFNLSDGVVKGSYETPLKMDVVESNY